MEHDLLDRKLSSALGLLEEALVQFSMRGGRPLDEHEVSWIRSLEETVGKLKALPRRPLDKPMHRTRP